MYSELTSDDGQTNCPKLVDFHDKIKCEISAPFFFITKKFVPMHGHMKGKYVHTSCRGWYDKRRGQNFRIEPCQYIVRQHV